jgi:DNA repair exonuclease SbcCD ATPase subunit
LAQERTDALSLVNLYKKQMSELEQEIATAREKEAERETANADELSRVQNVVETLTEKLEAAETSRDESLDQLDLLQNQVDDLLAQLTELSQEKNKLQQAHEEAMASRKAAYDVELNELKAQVNVLTKKEIESKDTLQEHSEEIQVIGSAKEPEAKGSESNEDELFQRRLLEEAIAEYEEELVALEGQNVRLKEEIEQQKKLIEGLEKELIKTSRQSETAASISNTDPDDLNISIGSINDREWTELTDVVDNLKEENEALFSEKKDVEQRNKNQMKFMQILEDKFHSLKSSTEKREAYLFETIRRQKISIDSLWKDLTIARGELAQLKQISDTSQEVVDQDGKPNAVVGRSNSKSLSNASSSASLSDDNVPNQSVMLESVMEKQSTKRQTKPFLRLFAGSTEDSGREGPAVVEARCKQLEDENQMLKSNFVKLQTKYKEAMYKHKQTVEELELANDAIMLKNMALADAVHGDNQRGIM